MHSDDSDSASSDSRLGRPPRAHHDTVSILGTGMLGTALGRAFLHAGQPVTAWNRTARKADPLIAAGAYPAATPTDAITASRLLVVAIPTYDDVHALLVPEVEHLAGRTLVNLSSGTPEQARSLSTWATERQLGYLDGAAMSGTRLVGQPEALFLYSGASDQYATHEATLGALGRAVHLGPDPGAASAYDTALLSMNMGVLGGFYQAVALAGASGIDAPTFTEVVVDYLPFVTGLLPRHADQIDRGHYPGEDGTLEVLAAAMGHVVDTARRHGLDAALAATITALLERGVAAGHREDGVARLADVIAGR